MDALSSQTALSQEKRAKILQIARKRMMHYGVAKTTMSEIAEEAQMAVGTIYLYFKNKEEIVLALGQACRSEQDERLQMILNTPGLTASQKLETFLLEKFRYVQNFRYETPHGKELIAYLVQNFPELLTEWEERFESAVKTILEQGVAQKTLQIDDVSQAAHLLRLATTAFFPLPYLELPKYPNEEDLKQLVQWFLERWTCA